MMQLHVYHVISHYSEYLSLINAYANQDILIMVKLFVNNVIFNVRHVFSSHINVHHVIRTHFEWMKVQILIDVLVLKDFMMIPPKFAKVFIIK